MRTPTSLRTSLQPEEILRQLGVRSGWKVADFGCGAGFVLVPVARFVGSSGRVVGVDVRAPAVDESRRRAELAGVADRVDVFRADLTKSRATGLPDGWADLVLLVGVLYQSDPRTVLREAARVVKPTDGRVAVIEWEEVATPIGPPAEQRIGRDTILAAGKSAGLTFLSPLNPSPHQYGLLFVRGHESGTAGTSRRAVKRSS